MKQCQLLISGLGLAAPGSPFSAGATLAQQGAELSIKHVAPPTSLDPHLLNSPINHAVQNTIWNALILNDPKPVSKPSLAESWHLADEKTWKFKLRHGVTFSDGSAVTVQNAIGSLKQAASVKSAVPFAQ